MQKNTAGDWHRADIVAELKKRDGQLLRYPEMQV